MEIIITKSKNETIKFAEKFALSLSGGETILLYGDLGAGKTVFVKGIVNKLSNNTIEAVSPTFVLLNTYNTKPQVNHFDLYRINSLSELDAIGFEEYLYSNSINIIEWPERAEEIFSKKVIKIKIEKLDENSRKIMVER